MSSYVHRWKPRGRGRKKETETRSIPFYKHFRPKVQLLQYGPIPVHERVKCLDLSKLETR